MHHRAQWVTRQAGAVVAFEHDPVPHRHAVGLEQRAQVHRRRRVVEDQGPAATGQVVGHRLLGRTEGRGRVDQDQPVAGGGHQGLHEQVDGLQVVPVGREQAGRGREPGAGGVGGRRLPVSGGHAQRGRVVAQQAGDARGEIGLGDRRSPLHPPAHGERHPALGRIDVEAGGLARSLGGIDDAIGDVVVAAPVPRQHRGGLDARAVGPQQEGGDLHLAMDVAQHVLGLLGQAQRVPGGEVDLAVQPIGEEAENHDGHQRTDDEQRPPSR